MSYLVQSIQNKKVLISCGSGGVGKTTLSASIALYGALCGKRVLVLTIDPAKRLANALGFKNFSTRIHEINIGEKGSLFAMMLDTEKAFDDLIKSYSPSQIITQRILENSIYQHISKGLTGIHEYMAIATLYEVYKKNEYDLIVLDTPPMRKAFDFLEAPQRISDFFDAQIFNWFLKPYFKVGKTGFKFLMQASALPLKVIEKFSGMEVLRSIHEFFVNFEEMYEAFHKQALAIQNLLKSDEASFLLITSLKSGHLEEAESFHEMLISKKMSLEGFVFNQVLPVFKIPSSFTSSVMGEDIGEGEVGKILDYLKDFDRLARKERKAAELLIEELDFKNPPLFIPRLSEEVSDLEGLKKFHKYLFGL